MDYFNGARSRSFLSVRFTSALERFNDGNGAQQIAIELAGLVEKFDKSGKKHLGEYDTVTGAQTKPSKAWTNNTKRMTLCKFRLFWSCMRSRAKF
ncbi:hypothetical protein HFO97_05830 [Rhizobium leguminosarum]|uniref:colicin E3/pyocin S6 family cytotoxin n=1 Tax=Rhizobium leguminosarum TaxID=384 RepID=UPI001C9682CE|nr:colicin E3/pyocin S6 family cytotoxin [Rhizobium leguminosarum]MBY5359510.1 hypothetical protein [Rhizobium leguminosarum]